MDNIHVSMTAILITVVANFVFGYIWYTPLFGKAWAKEMKMSMDEKVPTSEFVKGLSFMVIGNFLMAFVFAHNIAAWNPLSWGQPASSMSPMATVLSAAGFTWLGFYFPGDLSSMAWERRSFKLFAINTVYHLLSLVIAAGILVKMS
ncbi:MAG TPA: DUF1761 domain-containing protein [Bacteroidia bacterium]|nr:DUF1761 domain-containing protein [Bacteroidia bacterium]